MMMDYNTEIQEYERLASMPEVQQAFAQDKGWEPLPAAPVAPAFDHFEVTVVRSLQSLVQCVFLDIGSPGCQLIHLHEDGINLVIFEGIRHLEVVAGKFQVIFGSLSAGGFHLAELAVVSGSKFAFALHSQLAPVKM